MRETRQREFAGTMMIFSRFLRLSPFGTLLTACLLALLPGAAATADDAANITLASTLDRGLFPLPHKLQPNVDFWTQVYTRYSSEQVLIHDHLYLQVVYAVVDCSDIEGDSSRSAVRKELDRKQRVKAARELYARLLGNLAAGRASTTHAAEQGRIARMFAAVPGDRTKFAAAARRVRSQTCLSDRFAEAIEISGLYMPAIEEIFSRRGLPSELTRLPFVESMFNTAARSAAAAGGIWQFMPSTARQFMKLNLEVDERYDPWRATEAAASLLSQNYANLGTWPLAITAYNHGRGGMARAVSKLGTKDLGEIATRYRSRSFGFASRNFYAEFLAAAETYSHRRQLFPDSQPRARLAYDELVPNQYVALTDLAAQAGATIDQLQQLNPALNREIWRGDLLYPKGYPMRVPQGSGESWQAAYEQLGAASRSDHQRGLRYRVRRGDSLSAIADKFGTRVSSLVRANRLRSAHRIRIGQVLLIPARGRSTTRRAAATSSKPAPRQANPAVHIVRRGENLTLIAGRYGTTVNAIRQANNLRSGNHLSIGQRLTIPAAGSRSHTVRSGDTLASIARRYGTSISSLKRANHLGGHLIHPNQVLLIP